MYTPVRRAASQAALLVMEVVTAKHVCPLLPQALCQQLHGSTAALGLSELPSTHSACRKFDPSSDSYCCRKTAELIQADQGKEACTHSPEKGAGGPLGAAELSSLLQSLVQTAIVAVQAYR